MNLKDPHLCLRHVLYLINSHTNYNLYKAVANQIKSLTTKCIFGLQRWHRSWI